MTVPGDKRKRIVIPIDKNGNASPPLHVEVGPEYLAIEFSASVNEKHPTLLIKNIKLFSDSTKAKEVTSDYFQSQEYWGRFNRICNFKDGLTLSEPVTLWYDIEYDDMGVAHETDPTVTIDARGGW